MMVDDPEFSIGSALKGILLSARREWSFYATLVFPIILILGIMKFINNQNIDENFNRISMVSWIIIIMIGILYTSLLFNVAKKLINRFLQINDFIAQVVKHTLKMFALFVVSTVAEFMVSSFAGHDISEDNSLISNFPVITLCVLIFISNYGLSSIICTGSSKKSLLIVLKLLFTSYTAYNALFFVLLFGVFFIGKILPNNPLVAQIVGYPLIAILFAAIPLNVVFLTMIAINKKLLMVQEN
jgi:hypothetical protein